MANVYIQNDSFSSNISFFCVMVCLVIFHPFARFIIAIKRHTITGSKKLVRCVHSRKINIILYIFIRSKTHIEHKTISNDKYICYGSFAIPKIKVD